MTCEGKGRLRLRESRIKRAKCLRRIMLITILLSMTMLSASYTEERPDVRKIYTGLPQIISPTDMPSILEIISHTPDRTLDLRGISAQENESATGELDDSMIGLDVIELENSTLVRYNLPEDYYPDVNHSYFQPYMCWTKVRRRNTPSWQILNSPEAYTDDMMFRRYYTNGTHFTIDGEDDFLVAMGNYYKERGSVGDRFLIISTTGMYTIRIGGEKANDDTERNNMFTRHGTRGQYAGFIEWIVDVKSGEFSPEIQYHGTVTVGPVRAMQGSILYIYKIHDS